MRLIFCSWQYSRREILRAKSPGPASTVKVEAAGDGGTTLTGADEPYNDEAFRAKTSPNFQCVCSPAGLTEIQARWSQSGFRISSEAISRSSKPENLLSLRLFFTAIASAFRCPMITTSFLPRVVPV
jgi:hypothetical protein